MTAVPQIETARLRLRSFRTDDLDSHAAMLGDAEVVRHVGGKRLSREEAWRRLVSAGGMWPLLGYGYWAVERRDTGAYIGLTGFADFKRDLAPSIEGLPEMGWIFVPEAQGHGFAFEAAQAGLQWADRNLTDGETVAIINPDNARSIRLARRLGFGEGDEALYGEETVLLLRRPLPAATAASATATA